ncbi:MAG: DJ-1/PfpI family protein [Gemmatimonadota bacterium]
MTAAGRTIGILLFDDVDVLDACGPFEVFSVAGATRGLKPFAVRMIAEENRPVVARNGLRILPDHTTASCPPLDILLVPGGMGTRREVDNAPLVAWIAERAKAVELVLSVCTGALLLGKAGLLDGLRATTHHLALDLLRQTAPAARIEPDQRVVDNGKVVLSAGVAAGIDMSLHVVARLLGEDVARETAAYMELPPSRGPNHPPPGGPYRQVTSHAPHPVQP